MPRSRRLSDKLTQRITEIAHAEMAGQPPPPERQQRAELLQWLRAHPLEASLNQRAPHSSLRCEMGMIQGHPVAGGSAELYDGTGAHRTMGARTVRAGRGRLTVILGDGHVIGRDIDGHVIGRAAEWAAVFSAYANSLTR